MYLFCVTDFPKEVQFQSPRAVTVSRAVEYGDSVVVACTSSPSNPPAAIRFRIYANDNLNPVQEVEPTQTVSNRKIWIMLPKKCALISQLLRF